MGVFPFRVIWLPYSQHYSVIRQGHLMSRSYLRPEIASYVLNTPLPFVPSCLLKISRGKDMRKSRCRPPTAMTQPLQRQGYQELGQVWDRRRQAQAAWRLWHRHQNRVLRCLRIRCKLIVGLFTFPVLNSCAYIRSIPLLAAGASLYSWVDFLFVHLSRIDTVEL